MRLLRDCGLLSFWGESRLGSVNLTVPTGRFHDGNVSGLLAEVFGPVDSNEVAQRMWRSRNYARLEKQFSKLTDFAVATSVVIGNRT